ncbi:Hypothetical protein PHPALM_20367 [Phytophthora palmivora]|uniref:Uncharacterized protein n=1 Tax=Phytophthora palmivora TaxID=4796 RepID=A0A2P4XF16_9STRA|nr:Hypothetical protein PHPALM_20367 [Phytophthora palmivora]
MCLAKTSNSPTDSATSDTETNTSVDTASSSTDAIESDSSDILEFEGTATFAPAPAPTYRYTLSLENNKLRIWFEDCQSKKQWCTARLKFNEYVNITNAIPNATATDYVEYFRELIDGAHDDDTNASIEIENATGDLELQVKIHVDVLHKSRVATYNFKLEAISLDRIDMLESKLRDLQEEVNTLRANDEKTATTHSTQIERLHETVQSLSLSLKKLEGEVASHTQTIQKLDEVDVSQTSKLQQLDDDIEDLCQSEVTRMLGGADQVNNEHADSFYFRASDKVGDWILWDTFPNGIVSSPASGTFYVVAVVNYQTSLFDQFIQLIRGNTLLKWESCDNRYLGGHSNTASLLCITYLEKNDQLAVHCPVSIVGISYLALVRVGN